MNETYSNSASLMDTLDFELEPEDLAVTSKSELATTDYHAMESSIRWLKAEQGIWRDEIVKIKNENLQLQSKFDDVTKLMQSRVTEWSLVGLENSTLLAKLKEAEDNEKAMEAEIQRLKEENLSLNRASTKLKLQNNELQQEVEQQANELSVLQNIEANTSYDFNVQEGQGGMLEKHMLIMTKHITKSRVVMENIEESLTAKISSKVRILNKQNEALSKLVDSYKHTKIENATKMEMQDEMIRKLKETSEECEREYKEVTGKLQQLEFEKVNADKEVANLHELVQALEVHLKLLDQKFKITKSENKEKEEANHKKIKDLQEKCRQLEEHCVALYEEIRYREIELEQIKEVAEIGLASLGESFEKFEMEFEEKSTRVEAQLSKCYEGLHNLKGVVTSKLEEEFEIRELLVRVMYQGEIISMLKEESSNLAKRLAEKEKEDRRLTLIARDHEIKVQELVAGARARGKDEEGMAKDDVTGEIIRQLWILMEYYRENCNNFLCKLSTKLKQIKPFT